MEYVQDMKHMSKIEVLYEDNHIIVVVKPPNVLSQADSTKDIDMLTIVKEYIKEKYNKKGNVYLGLVHRLDRPVGGVMIFARSSKAASRMTEMIKNHEFTKKYLAVVRGTLKEREGFFEDYLLKEENGNAIVTTKEKGKYSKLNYKVLKESKRDNLSVVEIELLTGRHHQIRVQFASRGICLYGDQRYGVQDNKQIALWAYSLTIIHPTLKKEMTFIKYPNNSSDGWNFFDLQFMK